MLSQKNDEQIKTASASAMGYMELSSRLLEKIMHDTMMPAGIREEMLREREANRKGYFQEYISLSPLPNIPVCVLLSYNRSVEPPEEQLVKELKINLLAWWAEENKYHIQDFAKMIKHTTNSFILLLPGYPHYIHHKDPELVASVILNLYKKSLKVNHRPKNINSR